MSCLVPGDEHRAVSTPRLAGQHDFMSTIWFPCSMELGYDTRGAVRFSVRGDSGGDSGSDSDSDCECDCLLDGAKAAAALCCTTEVPCPRCERAFHSDKAWGHAPFPPLDFDTMRPQLSARARVLTSVFVTRAPPSDIVVLRHEETDANLAARAVAVATAAPQHVSGQPCLCGSTFVCVRMRDVTRQLETFFTSLALVCHACTPRALYLLDCRDDGHAPFAPAWPFECIFVERSVVSSLVLRVARLFWAASGTDPTRQTPRRWFSTPAGAPWVTAVRGAAITAVFAGQRFIQGGHLPWLSQLFAGNCLQSCVLSRCSGVLQLPRGGAFIRSLVVEQGGPFSIRGLLRVRVVRVVQPSLVVPDTTPPPATDLFRACTLGGFRVRPMPMDLLRLGTRAAVEGKAPVLNPDPARGQAVVFVWLGCVPAQAIRFGASVALVCSNVCVHTGPARRRAGLSAPKQLLRDTLREDILVST